MYFFSSSSEREDGKEKGEEGARENGRNEKRKEMKDIVNRNSTYPLLNRRMAT
jgi:hypothetical protein